MNKPARCSRWRSRPVSHLDGHVRVSIDPGIAEVQGSPRRDARRHACVVNDFSLSAAAPWHEQARASGIKSLATFP